MLQFCELLDDDLINGQWLRAFHVSKLFHSFTQTLILTELQMFSTQGLVVLIAVRAFIEESRRITSHSVRCGPLLNFLRNCFNCNSPSATLFIHNLLVNTNAFSTKVLDHLV